MLTAFKRDGRAPCRGGERQPPRLGVSERARKRAVGLCQPQPSESELPRSLSSGLANSSRAAFLAPRGHDRVFGPTGPALAPMQPRIGFGALR